MIKGKLILVSLMMLLVNGSLLSRVYAQDHTDPGAGIPGQTNTLQINRPTTNQPAATSTQVVDLRKRLLSFHKPVNENFSQIFSRFINLLLSLVGSVSVIFIVIGGFQLAFSRGNAEAAATGKKTITWAVIGFAIALLVFAIVNIVERLVFP